MWRSLSLNTKLLVFLIGLQALFLAIGALWLVSWEEKLKYQELGQQLDLQSDAIEDMVTIKDNGLHYSRGGEIALELDHDDDTYFAIFSEKNDFIDESKGLSDKSKERLKVEFSHLTNSGESEQLQWIDDGKWLALYERISKENNTNTLHGIVYLAINAQPTLKTISDFKEIAVFSAITMLLVTSLGMFLVVSFSTRNLNKFALQLTALKSPSYVPDIDLTPQSTQEKMLFDGYRSMAASIKSSMDNQRLFIANASHELKTPIAAALAALEVSLEKPRTAEDYRSTCTDIMVELQTLKRLSNALLDLASLEELTTVSGEACHIHHVVLQVIERWEKKASEKGIRLQYNSDRQACKTIVGSTEKWEVIIGNLVDNAIKYGRANGHVWIHTKMLAPDSCEIHIRDDGPGMSDDEMAQLGKIFYRADSARSDQHSFGLGFAHAKRLVECLGGSVSVLNAGGFEVIIMVPTKSESP